MTAPQEDAMSSEVSSVVADRIAADFRYLIGRGEYGPGERLPSERSLVRDHETTRPTVRSALAQFQAAGLAVTRQGAVYVRDFR
ncbi:hypothetical protein GCM10027059_36440 [Myceligenerans halotolerans]